MSKFKHGDKVRLVSGHTIYGMKSTDVFEVDGVSNDNDKYIVLKEKPGQFFIPDYFEEVSKQKKFYVIPYQTCEFCCFDTLEDAIDEGKQEADHFFIAHNIAEFHSEQEVIYKKKWEEQEVD